MDFINDTDLDKVPDVPAILETFYTYAQEVMRHEAAGLIAAEGLNETAAKRYLTGSLKRGYASENGTELTETLPKMSPLNPQYLTKKQSVFQKIAAFVEKFAGIGPIFDKMPSEPFRRHF